MSSAAREAPANDEVYVYPTAVKKEDDAGAWGGPGAAAAGSENVVTPLEFGSRQFTRAEERRINMELMEDVPQRDIRTRPGPGGQRLHYLAGWKSVEIANRIFGFNGWSERTVSKRTNFCEQMANGRWAACVICSVRVTLKDGTYREDTGGGSADNLKSRQDCIMLAEKEAVTDARKRALKNFGRRLGLSLYDDEFLRDLASDNAKKVKALKAANAAKHAQAAAAGGRPATAGAVPGSGSRQVAQRQSHAPLQQQRGAPVAGTAVKQAPPASSLAAQPHAGKENMAVIGQQVKQTVSEVNNRMAQLEQQRLMADSALQLNAPGQASARSLPPAQSGPRTPASAAAGSPAALSPAEEQKRRDARLLKAKLMQEQAKKNRAASKPRSAERTMFNAAPVVVKSEGTPTAGPPLPRPAVGMSPVTPAVAGSRQGRSSPPGLNPPLGQKRSLSTPKGPLPRNLNDLDVTPQPAAKMARRTENPAAASFTTANSVGQSAGSSATRRPRSREEEERILAEYAAANNF